MSIGKILGGALAAGVTIKVLNGTQVLGKRQKKRKRKKKRRKKKLKNIKIGGFEAY